MSRTSGTPRGRGAAGKTIVFDLLKRGNCVYTEIVPNACKATLQAIIGGKVEPNSVIHTDVRVAFERDGVWFEPPAR